MASARSIFPIAGFAYSPMTPGARHGLKRYLLRRRRFISQPRVAQRTLGRQRQMQSTPKGNAVKDFFRRKLHSLRVSCHEHRYFATHEISQTLQIATLKSFTALPGGVPELHRDSAATPLGSVCLLICVPAVSLRSTAG